MNKQNYKFGIDARDNTRRAFDRVNGSINRTNAALGRVKGMFAAAFSIAIITRFANSAIDAADNIGKTASAIGVTAEFLQRYQFVAQQAGLTTEEFNKSMTVFSKMIGEAMTGVGEAKMALESLGVTLRKEDGTFKSTEELFIDFFKATDNISSSMKKAAYFSDVFGRAGVKNTVMAKNGTAAMQEMARVAPGIFTDEAIKTAEDWKDTMNELNRTVLVPIQQKLIWLMGFFMHMGKNLGVLDASRDIDILKRNLSSLEEEKRKLEEGGGGGIMSWIFGDKWKLNKDVSGVFLKGINKDIEETKKQIELLEAVTGEDQGGNLTEFEVTLQRISAGVADLSEKFGDVDQAVTKVAVSSFAKFEDALVKSLRSGKLEFKTFADYIIEQLLRIAIQQTLLNPFRAFMSPIFSSAGQGLKKLPSFEGGGFTGSGSRSGGVDGRGGFPAILHPNETVVDGAAATVNFNIQTVDAAGFDQLLNSRKGMITAMINNAMNNRGKMGVI